MKVSIYSSKGKHFILGLINRDSIVLSLVKMDIEEGDFEADISD